MDGRQTRVHARRPATQSLWEQLDLGSPDETRWMADAQCAQTDPDAFFPEKGGSSKKARSVCLACPVRAECAAYAVAHDERFGMWGGLSENQRRAMRRRCATGSADNHPRPKRLAVAS